MLYFNYKCDSPFFIVYIRSMGYLLLFKEESQRCETREL